MSSTIITKNKLLSLQSEIQSIYKIYESGDIDLFEKKIDEIKIKYANKKQNKKDEKNDKIKELQKKIEDKDKEIKELLSKDKNNDEDIIKDMYEKEYNLKLADFKLNYKYDIKENKEYKILLQEKEKLLKNNKSIDIDSIKHTYQSQIKELNKTINELNETIKELNKEKELLKNKKNKSTIVLKNDNVTIEEDYGCHVNLFENRFNDTRKKCSEKTQYDVKYFYDLYERCKLDTTDDYNALDDAAVYMLNIRKTTINNSNRDIYGEIKY